MKDLVRPMTNQAPGVIESVLGLAGAESVHCDRWQINCFSTSLHAMHLHVAGKLPNKASSGRLWL